MVARKKTARRVRREVVFEFLRLRRNAVALQCRINVELGVGVTHPATRLRILPYYTGYVSLEEALRDSRGVGLLWLEILFNPDVVWQDYLHRPEVRSAYDKACVWYSHFKTMIEGRTGRPPLPPRAGEIDMREHRRFLEALQFVATGP